MTYHVRHIGHIDTYAQLLREGWTVLGSYRPISPVIDIAVWLRCPPSCCGAECPDCGEGLRCRCQGGEG